MADVTFRDFAGAVMRGDDAAAARTLATLLGLGDAEAASATAHFRREMAAGGQAFVAKAMGLRTAVASGTDLEIAGLLAECFGLAEPVLSQAAERIRTRTP
jgi:hypothetical protein